MTPFDIVNRANAEYIDQLYAQYQRDPRSVDANWQAFFAGFDAGAARNQTPGGTHPGEPPHPDGALTTGVYDLVHTYRELGHFVARLDPLGHDRPSHPLLQLSEFGLTTADLDKPSIKGGFCGETDGTLRDLIEKLRATYCRTIGVEFMDIPDKAQREWLAQRMEPILNKPNLTAEESRAILFQLVAAEEFEKFLHTRYVGQKRFSIEGGESLITLLNTLIEDGSNLGVEEAILGMAHRGRLNVLAHVMNKPYETILSEFEGTYKQENDEGDGDVKYHLGYSNERTTAGGRKVHLLLSPNPSHLELVNPVMQGIVRSKQTYTGDKDRNKIIPITLHGDAAFTGQGIVQETLGLSEMPGYRTGGTVHVIVNNQIGFTATPKQTRFTPYPTDIAKSIQAPMFHVNGDDPEAVVHAARLAIAFREQFKMDVILDLWCYRRHGHNETDEPGFTQPVMYRQIESHKTTTRLYAERLEAEGKIEPGDYEEMRQEVINRLTAAQALAKELKPRNRNVSLGPAWRGMTKAPARAGEWQGQTAVKADVLRHVVDRATNVPADFTPHPKIKRVLSGRKQMVETGRGLDWGGAEMLAMGSLLLEGHWVRLMGQDAERGTFSHRHAILYDFESGKRYVPLAHLSKEQGHITITNSMLSELAVLGFEYGYTLADPRPLVVWEAQFGDFVNGAQPIIDQFIVAGESKWQLMSGLVMLLPHGYEGQGPEHSNAYVERWLSLCAENNIQVATPTTPAQYFHLLRRQIHRKFRKPLVVFTPKGLLRYEPSFSTTEELTAGHFNAVIDDPHVHDRERIRRVLLCTGKVYYTLQAAREKTAAEGNGAAAAGADVAIIRVEQLYPFPEAEVRAMVDKYRRVEEIAWVQEEPRNRGAWTFMEPRLRAMFPDTLLAYYGRDESASPAVGSVKTHQVEEKELVAAALNIRPQAVPVAKGTPATASAETAASQ
ncbi:MAG TPA: 2-oxoglutarate dehydrogenase E1 component [Tepidisphaeraceae bacterium]|nr:2-oxoglutarate dehydrogenase E1 component [Tepidisphaeraceae bacterium]